VAKLRDDTIKKEDIKEYLDNYSDFSFEIKVVRTLTEHNFICQHGGTYEDPVTGKAREFDIRAVRSYPLEEKKTYRMCLSVECKNIKENFPLVVHCTPRTDIECYQDLVWSHRNEFGSQIDANPLTLKNNLSGYSIDDPVGKSCDQVGRKGPESDLKPSDADIFDKISQAINSAYDFIKQSQNTSPKTIVVSSIVPVLVIPKGRLWRVCYDDSGNITEGPSLVSWVSYYIGKTWPASVSSAYGQYTHDHRLSHLEIIELDSLGELLTREIDRAGYI